MASNIKEDFDNSDDKALLEKINGIPGREPERPK